MFVVIALTAASLLPMSPIAHVESIYPKSAFSSCEKLRNADGPDGWPMLGGVARSSSVVGITGATVDPKIYQSNSHLDADRDGIACEKFVYDSGVTKTSPGTFEAYNACLATRAATQRNSTVLLAPYPYENEYSWLQNYALGWDQAARLMARAAAKNPVFTSGLKSAEKWNAIAQKMLMAWPRDPGVAETTDFNFDAWCAYFGIYSSQKGLFPPVDIKYQTFPSTALNGARYVCKKVFYYSPDRMVYSKGDALSLNQCDAQARSIARYARDYDEAREEMVYWIFGSRDYWCWGKNCVTEDDVW